MLVCLIKWLQPIVLKCMAHFIRAVTKEALPGGGWGSHVARLNFKMSCVTVINACHLLSALASLSQFGRGRLSLLRFHFTHCRYFLSHVACQNLPWQGLTKDRASERKMEHKERRTTAVQFPTNYRFHIPCNLKS